MKINKKWVLLEPDETDENFQIIPLHDLRKHLEIGASCWCEPKVDFENGKRIVVHSSKDGREKLGDKDKRKRRLEKIKGCQTRLEARLLNLFPRPCDERNDVFADLYYLVALAKRK